MDASRRMDCALRFACSLLQSDALQEAGSEEVTKLKIFRAIPPTISLTGLLHLLPNLQEVDISGNQIGPQALQCIMIALAADLSPITSLNVANNMADADTAASIGGMLHNNKTITSLDVSGNYLGKESFSKHVSEAMKQNHTLEVLNCESIGSTDMDALCSSLDGSALRELNINHNELSQTNVVIAVLESWLQSPQCQLRSLKVKNVGFKGQDLEQLGRGVAGSRHLQHLDVSANQIDAFSILMEMIVTCACHMTLTSLVANDIRVADPDKAWIGTPHGPCKHAPAITNLSLSNCSLNDDLISHLVESLGINGLAGLRDLNLSNNPSLSTQGLNIFIKLSSGAECSMEKLSWGLNNVDGMVSLFNSGVVPKLYYLNLGKAKTQPTSIGQFSSSVCGTNGLTTLVLDGIKLAGSQCIAELLASGSECRLDALSFSGCSLADPDIQQLAQALRNGLQLHMLKLSANRISDACIVELVDALMSHSSHPLKLIDLSNNQISSDGALKMRDLFVSEFHKTSIHSVNLSMNNITVEGLKGLLLLIHQSSLRMLNLSSQRIPQMNDDAINELYTTIASALDLIVPRASDDSVVSASCNLPDTISQGLMVKLNGLGSDAGELGRHLDSAAINTDFTNLRLPFLPLQQVLELAAVVKGDTDRVCTFTSEEWNQIIRADKDAPRWLQLDDHIVKTLFLSHLPASITTTKLEGILEMEADCNIQDVFLLKDPVTRKNNGFAWVLMDDVASVESAVQYYQEGHAKVFGQPFIMSKVNIRVEGLTAAKKEAQCEMMRRAHERAAEETAHRKLINQSYVESQERHAWRLANPAYADGRIW